MSFQSTLHECATTPQPQSRVTSMDDWKVLFTMAATMATELTLHGLKKCTASTLAVTQGPLATALAARPAQMSIQLSTWPPKQMPKGSVSAGSTTCRQHSLECKVRYILCLRHS